MEIIFITVPVTLVFIAIGASIFFWASKKGQFDDLDSPAHRILFDDDIEKDNKPDSNDTNNSNHSDQDSNDSSSSK